MNENSDVLQRLSASLERRYEIVHEIGAGGIRAFVRCDRVWVSHD